MSETPTEPKSAAPARNIIRSRMRAAPNVAISSGMARNRRLSGHFTATPEKTIQPATNTEPITPQTESAKSPNALSRSRSPSITQSRSPARPNTDFNENSRETIMNTQFNSIQSVSTMNLKPKSPVPNLNDQIQAGIIKPRTPLASKINSPKINEDSVNLANSPLVAQANQAMSFR